MSMPKGSPRWTPPQLAYLQENYGSKTAAEIAATLGRTRKAIYERADKAGLLSRQFACSYFQQIDSPVKAYVLGLLAADGWVDDDGRVGVELCERDQSVVALVRDQIQPTGRLHTYQRRGGRQAMVRFVIGNVELAADLARHGVTPRKSHTISWPTTMPAEYDSSYICGFFDGDGHLASPPRLYWTVCSANADFLGAIRQRIEAATEVKPFGPYRSGGAWAITKSGEPVRALDAWLHRDVPGLARKRLPPPVDITG